MQYILTEEEYVALKTLGDKRMERISEKLQEVCTFAAENVPWGEDKETWGCHLTDKTVFCDECPVQQACPCEHKAWDCGF